MRTFLITFCVLFLSLCAFTQTVVKNVDAAEFSKLVSEKKHVLIDLRTPAEIKKHGTIEGAVQIDYLEKDAEKKIENLDRSKTYLVFCAGGGRSTECAEKMQELKFYKVYNLERGFDDWKRKGYAVKKETN